MPDTHTALSSANHAERLDRLAQVAVRVGLRLAPGQQLIITAPLDAVPLVRRITEHAYKAGASLVTAFYADDESRIARFRFAPDDAFDTAAGWLSDGMAAAFHGNAARMAVVGDDPALLAGQDPERVARANRAASTANRGVLELITRFTVNWTIVSYATPAWARAVFPGEPQDVAVAKLWDAIFTVSRVDAADPVAAWEAHNTALHARTTLLNAKRFSALHFRGPGTDLKVGLADGHSWLGGAKPAQNGIMCNPNIPSEEVYTTPHKDRVDGHVTSTKPLSYAGSLIQDIAVTFEGGRITKASARTGETVLNRVLDTDEGARRLGEVALVPHASPISDSGLLFQNTLFDENAASHIALGQAYSNAIEGGETMPAEALAARGANASLIHIDWMIGSGQIDVDGIAADGSAVPVMRAGAWTDAV